MLFLTKGDLVFTVWNEIECCNLKMTIDEKFSNLLEFGSITFQNIWVNKSVKNDQITRRYLDFSEIVLINHHSQELLI